MPGEEATKPCALEADASTIGFYLPRESSKQGEPVRTAGTRGQRATKSTEQKELTGRECERSTDLLWTGARCTKKTSPTFKAAILYAIQRRI